jgi:hypothetical protein
MQALSQLTSRISKKKSAESHIKSPLNVIFWNKKQNDTGKKSKK